ncbi:Hypothetical predicted protein [Paramuricea clavata]|uniref:Uncharacterized protein n=1 Tax=Paramuricea clavata TaxID=317549 RepID=A0A6S7HNR0_PARCT|nr:Hypothetical predicted protein [Paramuricea clavata]
MAEDIELENPVGVVDGFMDNWTEDQRRLFNEDWANDEGLCEELEQLPEPSENQMGEGSKQKHASDDVPSKRQRPEEYFTIKSVKQVNVRKFWTTGTDYTVRFNPLDVHGVSNVMSTLNRAFQHLFDRLTSDMAPHDQVRLILNLHQLDKSISLPFLQRDHLTPERFLAAIERVVQSNDQFTLDDSVSVNMVHVEMPNGAGRKRRDVVKLLFLVIS